MIVFPNAKINLGLNILSKRDDGYHNLQSFFLPVDIKDVLEVVVNKDSNNIDFFNSGLKINTPQNENLVVKAYNVLKKDFDLPPVKIHLHKVIPFEAGIGGGSADASFMLKLLNNKFELQLSVEKLEKYAKTIGADCPFFIKNKPALVQGIGDVLETINYDFSKFTVAIIKPNINLNTSKMFKYITPNKNVEDLRNLLKHPIEDWKYLFKNDFEKVIFNRHKELADIKNKMYEQGAVYSAMSGSGSTIFGFFDKLEMVQNLIFKEKIIITKILSN